MLKKAVSSGSHLGCLINAEFGLPRPLRRFRIKKSKMNLGEEGEGGEGERSGG